MDSYVMQGAQKTSPEYILPDDPPDLKPDLKMLKVKDEPFDPITADSPTAADDPLDLKPDLIILKVEDETFDPITAYSPTAADDPLDLKADLEMLEVKDEPFDPITASSSTAAGIDITSNKGVSTVRCVHCDYTCLGQVHLDKHIKQRHGHIGRDGRHKCEWCEYSTDRACHLRYHRVTHTGERPHRCDDCGKTFTRLSSLTAHRHSPIHRNERQRSGGRPYSCSFCAARFSQHSNLKVHVIAKHTHDYRHRCDRCGKGYIRTSELKNHVDKCSVAN